MKRTYLLEMSLYNGVTLITYRYGSRGYSHPSAPGQYRNRIKAPPTLRRDIFGRNTTLGGASSISTGDAVLVNKDGALDTLRRNGASGQPMTLLVGDADGVYSDFHAVLTGRIEQILLDRDSVSVRLRDRLQDLAKFLQVNKYAGTNSLPNGLEGVDDLKGRPKPLAFGQAQNVTPPCVNTSRLIYQVHDGAVSDVPNVYDAGVGLARGADYTSQVDMETNAPSAGNYRVWPAGGYFRLGSSPTGALTCDVTEGANAAARTAAQIAKRIVLLSGGLTLGDLSASDITALDVANSAVIGIWLDGDTNFTDALDLVLGSVGAWYGFDRLGIFRMRRFEAPGTAVATFRQATRTSALKASEFDILNLRLMPTSDPDKGIPSWRVSLTYSRNYTVQTDALGGAVTDVRKAFLSSATRSAVSSDSSVKTGNPNAAEKTYDTLFVSQADAQAEADRRLALFKVQRDFAELDATFTDSVIQAVDIGDTITAVYDRFGYDTGQDFVITGIRYNYKDNQVTLVVWG